MLSDEEKKEYEELKSLLYQGTLTQYGKRKLIGIIEKQSKEIEELKEEKGYHLGFIDGGIAKRYEYEDKIKAKIEELRKLDFGTNLVSQFTANSTTITILQSLLEKE